MGIGTVIGKIFRSRSPEAITFNYTLFGKQGYRVLIGHIVEMAEMLRERLEARPFIQVLNDYNYGPVTLFRVYPDGVDAESAFERELNDPNYHDQLQQHNVYNQQISQILHERAMRGEGVLLSWTSTYRYAHYNNGSPIGALKSFIMSPWTDLRAVDTVVQQILEARIQVKSTFPLSG